MREGSMGKLCLLCSDPAEEEHHVVRKAVDGELTIDLCRGCHRSIHRDMEEAGVQLDSRERDSLQQLVVFLRALGAFFIQLGERLLAWAHEVALLSPGGPDAIGEVA